LTEAIWAANTQIAALARPLQQGTGVRPWGFRSPPVDLNYLIYLRALSLDARREEPNHDSH